MTDETVEKSMSEDLSEMVYTIADNPFSTMTFSDLNKLDKTEDVVENLVTLHTAAHMMLYNILDYSPDRVSTAKKLIDEYYQLATTILSDKEEEKKSPGLLDKLKSIFGKDGSIKEKLVSLYRKPTIKENLTVPELNTDEAFMIWKDASGQLRWFGRYSNNFRDNDVPSDIITKQSHMRFVELVDSGQVPYPELWHWHIKGTKWGQADWVAYDEDNGVAMAAGYVLDGHEKEAELFSTKKGVALSHGMPPSSIKRDSNDKSLVINHVTREISDLPLWAAANKLTNFTIIKEIEMGIPAKKKEYLKEFLSEDQIKAIEEGNANTSKAANDEGIESKEASEAPVEVSTIVETAPVAEIVAEVKEEKVYITPDELDTIVKQLTDSLTVILTGIKDDIKEMKVARDEVKEAANIAVSRTPTASLAAYISKQMSAIGSKDTLVRKNGELSTSGPDETPAQEPMAVRSDNPILDKAITNILGRR
jgi:hypothetical protein